MTEGAGGCSLFAKRTLDVPNLARELSSSTPAKIACSSASVLLTTIKIGSLPPYIWVDYRLIIPGPDDQRSGLRRTGTSLRWRL